MPHALEILSDVVMLRQTSNVIGVDGLDSSTDVLMGLDIAADRLDVGLDGAYGIDAVDMKIAHDLSILGRLRLSCQVM
jgi:hypothetical protein